MKRNYSLIITSLAIVGVAFASNAQAADNGLSADGPALAGPAFLGPIDTQVNGPWLEFLFRGAGSAAEPCGGSCSPSSGGNSIALPPG